MLRLMNRLLRLGVLLGIGALSACEPDQWLITLYTDAPIPQLGNRLLVEIIDDSGQLACPKCSREFGVGDPERWPVSFGIDPVAQKSGQRLHVRAQLYRADHAEGQGVRGGAYLDALGQIPERHGFTRGYLVLRTDCFHVASELTPNDFQTCDAATGFLGPEAALASSPPARTTSQAGAWSAGRLIGCQEPAPDGMICVPGGAFIMGGLRYLGNFTDGDNNFLASEPESLVVLQPFFIDRDEYPVRDYYNRHQASDLTGVDRQGVKVTSLCTRRGAAADQEDLRPLNCVSKEAATRLCAEQGKRLPTEAEWEFVARNRTSQTLYPWGDDGDICAHALVARGATSWVETESGVQLATYDSTCVFGADGSRRSPELSPLPLGSDQSALGIRSLGGSLSEWVADEYRAYAKYCPGRTPTDRNWQENPLCNASASSLYAQTRGGRWSAEPDWAASIQRFTTSGNTRDIGIGFRCVQDLANGVAQ